MSHPLIGIAGRNDRSARPPHIDLFSISHEYVHAVALGGGAPVIIPPYLEETTLRAEMEKVAQREKETALVEEANQLVDEPAIDEAPAIPEEEAAPSAPAPAAAAKKKLPQKKVLLVVLAGGLAAIIGLVWLLSVMIAAVFGGAESETAAETPVAASPTRSPAAALENFQADEYTKPITPDTSLEEPLAPVKDLSETAGNTVVFVNNLIISGVILNEDPPSAIIDHVAYPLNSVIDPELGLKIIAIQPKVQTIVLRDAEGNNYFKPYN